MLLSCMRPVRTSLATVCSDGGLDGREEVFRVDRAGELVAFDLAADRVLHLCEGQRDAGSVELLVEVLQHVGGCRVDVCNRLGGYDDPGWCRRTRGELADLIPKGPCVREDERGIKAEQHKAGKYRGVGVAGQIVVTGKSVDAAEHRLIGPPGMSEDACDRQRNGNGDAG